jgi:hypothetical protein
MNKKCRYCGFKNPLDINRCLSCGKELPTSVKEFKEGMEALGKAVKGDWSGVAKGTQDEFVKDQVSPLKYRYNPVWVVKTKLHRLKQSVITIFWIFAIIGGIVILGLIYNFFKKFFGG